MTLEVVRIAIAIGLILFLWRATISTSHIGIRLFKVGRGLLWLRYEWSPDVPDLFHGSLGQGLYLANGFMVFGMWGNRLNAGVVVFNTFLCWWYDKDHYDSNNRNIWSIDWFAK